MKKIKVLQFPISNAKGGITQYVLQNWEFIDKDKFQFDFATLSKTLDFADKLKQQGCKVHFISCYAEDDEEQFTREVNHILDEEYDVIHLHTSYWKSFLVEKLALGKKVPKIIVHSHSTMIDIFDNQKRKQALAIHEIKKQQFSLSMATDFCACSQMAADWLFGSQIPKDKIRILNNAVDINKFSYDEEIRNQYRKTLNIENNFVIGHIGRFVYQKNHEFLIKVFKEVSQQISNAKLLLIGGGMLEEEIKKTIKKYGLDDKVVFLGKREDVNYLMQAMDVFLLPSRFEGLGLVLIEAQAAGLKCLASDVTPIEAGITNNIEYLPMDIDRWKKKVISFSMGYNRKDMSNIITCKNYNIRTQIKKLEELYYKNGEI